VLTIQGAQDRKRGKEEQKKNISFREGRKTCPRMKKRLRGPEKKPSDSQRKKGVEGKYLKEQGMMAARKGTPLRSLPNNSEGKKGG